MRQSPQNKDEVLRYLGYRDQILDVQLDKLIEESMMETRKIIKPRRIYRSFDVLRMNGLINLSGCNLVLDGEDIKEHLKKAERCVLMAVTLGNEIDTRIRYYERIDMTKALILDACATTAIEEICDNICEEIEDDLRIKHKVLTSRYSPGYGDLSIDIQKKFLSVLEAEKSIGLTVSDHDILMPRKSVTAIMGIINRRYREKKSRCLDCKNYLNCVFRKEDEGCGY